jgi:asparagine synthase (glutamine-hydrolysing)
MSRYIALIWNPSHAIPRQFAGVLARRLKAAFPTWVTVSISDGMLLAYFPDPSGCTEIYPLPAQRGLVVGQVFSDGSAAQVTCNPMSNADLRRIVESRGRSIVRECWGRYLVLLNLEQPGSHGALRDPSGYLPAFYSRSEDVDIYFGDTEDYVQLGFAEPTVRWEYVIGFLRHPQLQISDTGLQNVSELQPGEYREVANGRASRQFYWAPSEICMSEPIIDDVDAATAALTHTVHSCVNSWVTTRKRIVHQLSGGLDSSIVLSCLAAAPSRPEVLCLNYYSKVAHQGDERAYARLMAKHVGVEVMELDMDPDAIDYRAVLSHRRTAKPTLSLTSLQYHQVADVARRWKATAFTSGQGGDHVFFETRTPLIAADFARTHGIASGLFLEALHAARLTRTSVWHVLGAVIEYGLLKRPHDYASMYVTPESLVSPDAAESISSEYIYHPWLLQSGNLPPAKIAQIWAIVDFQKYHDPSVLTDATDNLPVLLSQPIVELCLRIPTYLLCCGELDRGLTRRAFAPELPPAITYRRLKSATTDYFSIILANNLPFMRELLLDGRLVREGLLNRAKLEKKLRPDYLSRTGSVFALISCLVAEAWVQSWTSTARRAVA